MAKELSFRCLGICPRSVKMHDGLMVLLAADTPEYTFKNLLDWLGRWHLLVLHTPIGLLAGLWATEILVVIRKRQRRTWSDASSLLLFLTAGSAIAAAALGWLLQASNPKAFGGPLIQAHLYWGIGTAILLTVLWFVRYRATKSGWVFKGIYATGLMLGSAAMSMTGHTGGSSVHSEDFLTRGAPPFIKRLVEKEKTPEALVETAPQPASQTPEANENASTQPPATDANSTALATDIYADQIVPILIEYCTQCHDPEQKIKGGLDMTTVANLFGGGNSGLPGIVPGKPDESEVYVLMSLPPDDDFVMPPKGDTVPIEKQTIIREWILAGAPTGDNK